MEENYKIIKEEWDSIALERFKELSLGLDKSYIEILKPTILERLKTCNLTQVLDIGCGVGILTEELGAISKEVIAIDLSSKSIEIAKENSTQLNVSYKCINFNEYIRKKKFTTIVSNMTVMTIPDLKNFFFKIHELLTYKGTFIFTITHPAFWPLYWDYAKNNFDYKKEIEIVREFKTRNKIYKNYQTRHYHRPIELYLNFVIQSKLQITNFLELQGNHECNWYPRFLLIECKKKIWN